MVNSSEVGEIRRIRYEIPGFALLLLMLLSLLDIPVPEQQGRDVKDERMSLGRDFRGEI